MTENGGIIKQPFIRTALGSILLWANLPPDERKPLILRGARQVGKSTLVRQLAAVLKRPIFEIDLEKDTKIHKIFNSKSAADILKNLKLLKPRSAVSDPGCILFFDEIQRCPAALESLRYFYEETPGRLVLAAGSLLDFALSEEPLAMPVGRIQYGFMQPCSFRDFVRAIDEPGLADFVGSYKLGQEINDAIHERLSELSREFLFVGGMPEAVRVWGRTRDPGRVRRVHKSLLDTYRDDFGKYASGQSLIRLQKLFDVFPAKIGRKVKYSEVDPHEQSRDIRSAVDLLCKARILNRVHHSNCSGLPLISQSDDFIYKIYHLDIGLLAAAMDTDFSAFAAGSAVNLLNQGALAEQFVFQNLKAALFEKDLPVFYWLREGKSDNAELDFVISKGSIILPIEVKSSSGGALRSLHQFVAHSAVKRAVRFHDSPPCVTNIAHQVITPKAKIAVSYELISLPLYLACELWRLMSIRHLMR